MLGESGGVGGEGGGGARKHSKHILEDTLYTMCLITQTPNSC